MNLLSVMLILIATVASADIKTEMDGGDWGNLPTYELKWDGPLTEIYWCEKDDDR